MGEDASLVERVQNSALVLLRAKGKYRDRLIDLALELEALNPRDFSIESSDIFVELIALIEKYRAEFQSNWGSFKDPSPKDRDRIAELVLELVSKCAVAEDKADQ
ncbi:MAG: hypothetical protein WBC85_13895 [Planktotalea sp.]|uniref:hypothetical protein n=1 Tax=Planktotalea sp. TaxID=2029877 RepID=UPI003C713346